MAELLQAVEAILNFMSKQGILCYNGKEGAESKVVESKDMVSVRTENSGFFEGVVKVGDKVKKGDLLAQIKDPYLGETKSSLYAPLDATVAFVHSEPMAYESTAVIKLFLEKESLL